MCAVKKDVPVSEMLRGERERKQQKRAERASHGRWLLRLLEADERTGKKPWIGPVDTVQGVAAVVMTACGNNYGLGGAQSRIA
jgi:hypothetical protein